jgi:hypothetical protein
MPSCYWEQGIKEQHAVLLDIMISFMPWLHLLA